MKYKVLVIPMLLFALCILLLPTKALADNNGRTVYVISLKDEITPAMSAYLSDKIEQANLSKAEGIIIDISTLGGRVDSALAMRDAIVNSKIPVVVYVGDRAESAGALITIAANTIIMAPGSHMGAAEPIPYSEKIAAFVSGEFHATAELRGRDPLIAAGMVDKNLEVPGFPKGTLVDISAMQAYEFGYADAVLKTMPEIFEYMSWNGAQILEVEPDYKIKLAQFLTKYEIASLLLTLGMIAFVIEIFVQGFGLPGFIGIVAFA
ncbi:MAG: ATP-dependent Clp protease proteolytic subunit, partial [Firmicutes bacterium]|nr:ATP-dependent Clp protease proteolytic subunit [Bacillota bacterium]